MTERSDKPARGGPAKDKGIGRYPVQMVPQHGVRKADASDLSITDDGMQFEIIGFNDVVAEHGVTLAQQRAFMEWLRYHVLEGKPVSHLPKNQTYYYKLMHRPWWRELRRRFLESRDLRLQEMIVRHDEELVEGYQEIITGQRSEDRSANAQVQAMKIRMEMGASPIINRRSAVNVNAPTYNDNRSVTFGVGDVRELSQEELLRWQNTGQLPERLSPGESGSQSGPGPKPVTEEGDG